MKIKMIIIILFSIFIFLMQPALAETIKIGYFNLQPHTYQGKDGSATGSAIVYFKMLAQKMGDTVEWIGPLPLPRLTQNLKDGEIDATLGFPKFPAFEEFLYYPDDHIYIGKPTFAVAKRNKLTKIKNINDIEGFRIGVVKSSSGLYTPIIDNNRDKIDLQELGGEKWMEQNLNKLVSGRLDALYDRQQYTLPYVATTLGIQNKIKLLDAPASPTPFYIAISKKSTKGKELLKRCNTYLRNLKYNYNVLVQKEINKLK
jgi:ABC-type amino acid transport substrate-binding protein